MNSWTIKECSDIVQLSFVKEYSVTVYSWI